MFLPPERFLSKNTICPTWAPRLRAGARGAALAVLATAEPLPPQATRSNSAAESAMISGAVCFIAGFIIHSGPKAGKSCSRRPRKGVRLEHRPCCGAAFGLLGRPDAGLACVRSRLRRDLALELAREGVDLADDVGRIQLLRVVARDHVGMVDGTHRVEVRVHAA